MKIFIRVILFILALVELFGLILVFSTFTDLPGFTTLVGNMEKSFPWLSLALSIVLLVCIAAVLLALILLASFPTGRNLYTLKKNMGYIEITKASIESAAEHTLAGIPDIRRFHVRAKGRPDPQKLRLYLEIEPKSADQPFTELADKAQAQVQESLKSSLDIDPGKIHVRVEITSYQDSADGKKGSSKLPRVI